MSRLHLTYAHKKKYRFLGIPLLDGYFDGVNDQDKPTKL